MVDPQSLIPPNASVIALLCALSNPGNNISLHQQALTARDQALSSSPESYSDLCTQFGRAVSCDSLESVPTNEVESFRNMDPVSFSQLTNDPSIWNLQLRVMAGLLLKNSLSRPPFQQGNQVLRMKLTDQASREIKQILLKCIIDQNQGVRNAASSCIAACTIPTPSLAFSEPAFPLESWPELIPYILQCCQHSFSDGQSSSNNEAMSLGALSTLRKLLEDNPKSTALLNNDQLVPTLLKILQICSTSANQNQINPIIIQQTLKCLHCFIAPLPTILVMHMDSYLQSLSTLSAVSNIPVKKQVCRTLVSLLSMRTEYLHQHITSIAEFILTETAKPNNEEVAREAAEFWLEYAHLEEEVCVAPIANCIEQIYPRLVPVLLQCMVYPPSKIEDLMLENESNANQNQLQTGQAPIFHRSKAASRSGNGGKQQSSDSDSEYDSDDDDEGGFNLSDDDEWTLRKCAAASLDALCSVMGANKTLPHLLPLLQTGFTSNERWVCEASILALGAVAETCQEDMYEHLPSLYPFLLAKLKDDLPQLRTISCWTLSRFSDWVCTLNEHQQQQFNVSFYGLCEEIVRLISSDVDKKVVHAACSAFSIYVESCSLEAENGPDSSNKLVPFLDPIYRNLISALEKSSTNSDPKVFMAILDTFGIMADSIGAPIGYGELPNIYIPPVLALWEAASNGGNLLDKRLLPLMESMASIALVTEQNFQPWALNVLEKCIQTIEFCMVQTSSTLATDNIGEEDYDPLICATDCIDGMVEGLSTSFAALVQSSERYRDGFLGMVHQLVKHDSPGVRMSAFALLGDLARRAPTLIEAGVSELLKEAVTCCTQTQHESVANNSTWAIGEICVKCVGNSTILQPLANEIIEKLIPLLMSEFHDQEAIPGLSENAAAAMGRFAKAFPDPVGHHLSRFFPQWCESLAKLSDPMERSDAFDGLVLSIQANPSALISTPSSIDQWKLTALIFAIVSWHIPPNEDGIPTITNDMLHGNYAFEPFPEEYNDLGWKLVELLKSIKESVNPEDWKCVTRMPVNIMRLLSEVYNV